MSALLASLLASDMADKPWVPVMSGVILLSIVTVAIWRRAWITLAAFAGALIGALAFVPVGSTTLDGPTDCGACGTYITVLVGASFRTP